MNMSVNGDHKVAITRRASASGTSGIPTSVSAASSSTRVHRSNESHHGFVGTHPTNAGPMAYTPANVSGSPQGKAVLALIKRLTAKLPCYSGLSLTDIEADNAVQLIIESLVELARHALDIIVWKLSEELERLAKADATGQRGLDVLQSELFLLKVMSVTLAFRWQQRKSPSKTSLSNGHMQPQANGSPCSPVPSLPRGFRHKFPINATFRDRLTNGPLWLDAPPLDENCARWLVSVMILLLRQAAPRDDRTKAYNNLGPDATLYTFESVDTEDDMKISGGMPFPSNLHENGVSGESSPAPGVSTHLVRKSPSLNSVSSSGSAPIPLPRSALDFQPTPRTLLTSSHPLYSLITEWAGKIVYLLSAANWGVVLHRIRTKIRQLSQSNPSDDAQDYTDLHLLHYCAVDRGRLVHVMQELSSLLVNMKRDVQTVVAATIRMTIWNWIDVFPSEYCDVVTGQRKLDGAPERLFDLLIQFVDDSSRRIIWPTLNCLLMISYDRMRLIAYQYTRQELTPKIQSKKEFVFLDHMIKNLSPGSKYSEISLLCHADMLRACSFAPPELDIALRSLASEVADDVKGRLWKAQGLRPFFESVEPIDVTLYADAIVGLSHFLPEEEFTELIDACLEPERSDAVKMVAVKTFISIDQLALKYPWYKAILPQSSMHRIRGVFRSLITRKNELDAMGIMRRSAPKPTAKRYTSEAISEKDLLLLAILAVCRLDIRFLMIEQVADIEASRIRMSDHCQIIRNRTDPAVPMSAHRSFVHAVNWLLNVQPSAPDYQLSRTWLGLLIPIVMDNAAACLLDSRDNFEQQRLYAEILYTWICFYQLSIGTDIANIWEFPTGRHPAMIVAEIALLVTLTSADTSVSLLAAKGLREMAIAECLPNPRRTVEEIDEALKRYPVYQQLGDPSVVVVGRVAQQKRVRKLLRLMTNPCPLHSMVWHECYWRWATLKDWVNRKSVSFESSKLAEGQTGFKPFGDQTMTSEEKFYQWQNLTLFLSSFGTISVMEQYTGKTLTTTLPISEIPDRFRIPQDSVRMLQEFMAATVEFLISELPVARDAAKEALGSELNPRLYARLFKQLNEVVDDVSKTAQDGFSSPQEEELLLVFLDQFLTVLKLLVDRPDSPSEDVLGNMDLNQTLLCLTKFMDRFTMLSCYKIRVKFCGFCESALARVDSLGLRKDDFVRNNLLDVIVEWTEPEPTSNADFSFLRLRHESHVASLRTMVKLLERLRLQPLDSSAGDDATHVISRRYLRYQNVLLHALQYDPHETATDDGSSQHSVPNQRKFVMEKDAGLCDLVINGLANLLSMNTDIGLKHFLPLGYDNDESRRIIFCRVISQVMDLGGKFETQSESVVTGRRMRIGELVKGSDMVLVLSICETCPPADVDVIIPVLLNLFDSRRSLLTLLKMLIEREVKTTQSEVGLFRGNTMRIKLLCAFAKIHGYDYLRQLVKPLLDQICSVTAGHTFILEPTKASKEEIAQNQKIIELLAQAFLSIVCGSAGAMPLMLREICAHISHTVAEVWPESKFAALGAFIFLRFISPALVSPETVDIDLPQDSIVIRRGLLIITKIIQNLANNVRFGKEAHMICFNEFLSNNIVRVMRFLTDVNKFASSAVEEEPDEWQYGTFDETDAIVLHRFFEKHADKVGKELLSLTKSSKEGEAAIIGGKKAWDTLCAALVDMGQPVEVPHFSPLKAADFGEYCVFMEHNRGSDTEAVSDLLTDIGVTKDDTKLYRLAIWKFDIEVLDVELLVYHIFKTLTTDTKPFEIIVDCTNYTTASEIPIQWFKFFIEMTPSDLRERLHTVHLLNCNVPMQRSLRKLYNICSGTFAVDVKSYLSVADLCSALNEDITGALDNAWSLEQEQKESFKGIMLRQAQHMKVPINLAVARSHLRIDSVKAQNIYPHFTSKSTEIVSYADIGDIYNVSTGRDANEFIIRRNRNGGTLYFSSPERDHIVKAIRTAKTRANISRKTFFDRLSRLSNVSAVLLNISMFNTYHDHPELRSAAFGLLSAVCSSINYDGELFLPSSGGIVPGKPVTFVTQLSEKLAIFAPELSLDFVSQVCVELDKATVQQKAFCLQYMNPWIKNMNKFCNPSSKLYELSTARLRDCIRLLIDLTVRDSEAYYIMQRYTWTEIGKLDSMVVNIVLDEIMRSAVDGGLGSTRCEIMADTLSSMCSVNARGRILAKLRKALGKTSTKPSKTLEKNAHWNEITAYSRLALSSGPPTKHTVQYHVLVPEIVHLVTLLASQGDLPIRNTIYGLALQMFQSLQYAHIDDSTLSSEIRTLLHELTLPETIRLFGLTRTSLNGEYMALDGAEEHDVLEQLARWLLRAVTVSAGNTGLANIWRARWMALLTSTAFQHSPSIQPRAFVVMGALASSDVDDDLLYQMLVALRNAMKAAEESDTQCVVSMLHCVRNVVPSLPESSRYISSLFWLAVALLQSGHAPFYKEANNLLCACITTLHSQGAFRERGFTTTLLDARTNLEDISLQLDQLLGLSFDPDFSFSLAAVIFKGIRRPQLRESATQALKCLMTTAMATMSSTPTAESPIHPDVLGYFLALLPVSTTFQSYIQLLEAAQVGANWIPTKSTFGRLENDNDTTPSIPFDLLACQDQSIALLAISFLGTMLSSAQGDDAESQMLFAILKEASYTFPDIISLVYDSLQDRIHDILSTSSNPSILSSVSTIFRVAMEDPVRSLAPRNSTTSLSTLEEESSYTEPTYGQKQLQALEDLNMQGLVNTFQFLPVNRGHVTKVLNWFPELISKIIE